MYAAEANVCRVRANIERLLNNDKIEGLMGASLQDALTKATKAFAVFVSVICACICCLCKCYMRVYQMEQMCHRMYQSKAMPDGSCCLSSINSVVDCVIIVAWCSCRCMMLVFICCWR